MGHQTVLSSAPFGFGRPAVAAHSRGSEPLKPAKTLGHPLSALQSQFDKAEKSFQIQSMDRLYGQAKGVLVWLGAEADESATIILILK